MSKPEGLPEFYQHHFQNTPDTRPTDLGQVNVFRLEESLILGSEPVQFSRRDFYKIALLHHGHSVYHYADQRVEATGPALLLFNPQIPYTRQLLSEEITGFFCILRKDFFQERGMTNLTEQPFFWPGSVLVYPLTGPQAVEVSALFEKMLTELVSDYLFKYDLLRTYATELLHYTLKLRPADSSYQPPDAKVRLTALFLELLERQFPIESPTQRFALRSARDFAQQLAVHPNHLNHCVRATTGKTTTDHIAARLSSEAKALLRHTDWNIAEVGYSLGFDEPAHFNYFFKKQTGLAPSAFRRL
ncbi:response regulator transcription factor [Larkinella knui]|uniref:AraC family transcriptional regulator n=1 Tax=Larkinella knui TaxID=2025310 RepID=A0A3P1CJU2_9BACT|nr:AraC family transcriptional regulator [Larkinella knui]RRB13577.1 AraC family transcriptional regulator [Larkinella knui]